MKNSELHNHSVMKHLQLFEEFTNESNKVSDDVWNILIKEIKELDEEIKIDSSGAPGHFREAHIHLGDTKNPDKLEKAIVKMAKKLKISKVETLVNKIVLKK